jgi:hypothetical protein
MTDLYRPPLIMPTPPRGRISAPDIFPNLLLTTLAVVHIALPLAAGRADASAPAVKAPVQLDSFVKRPSQQLGINPDAFIQRLDWPAPQSKYQVQLDRPLWPLVNQVVTQLPAVQGLCTSAPRTKIDVTAFMQVTTILPPAPSGLPLDTSQLQLKYAVYDTNASTQRPSRELGINPPAFIQQLTASAPFPKYQIQVDKYPNLQTSTFAPAVIAQPPGKQLSVLQLQVKYSVELDPAPYSVALKLSTRPVVVQQLSLSAPQVKYQPQVDIYPRLLAYLPGPVIPPLGKRIDTFLPQQKYQTYPDVYQNLVPLHQRHLPIDLPLGLPREFPFVQAKYQTQVDLFPNLLPLGISGHYTPDLCKQLSLGGREFMVQLSSRSFRVTLNGRSFTVTWEC